ncbi:MAG: XRE family transcriptional regulator [Ruminococcus flavefaciens]|nr:XRE family transcriptional regulator [Ruminococcus flavefaciens]MCM1061377.1 XRE family transcriptional regulator [Eubacterium sp.]
MTISQRVFHLLEKQGKKQTELSEYTGISTSTISAWHKRGTNPAADTISTIADFFEVSTDYLLTGKEKNSSSSKLTDEEQEMLDLFNALSRDNKIRIKERATVLAELETQIETAVEEESEEHHLEIDCSTYRVSAGIDFELGEGDEWYEIEVPDTPEARKADFALKIKGNSMEPIYFDGDIVLVKKQPSVDIGEIGIFNIEGNGYIKKFGGNKLISLNAEYDDIHLSDYDEERIHCFGKVIGRV